MVTALAPMTAALCTMRSKFPLEGPEDVHDARELLPEPARCVMGVTLTTDGCGQLWQRLNTSVSH